jgi:hypothetical protein
MPDWLWFVAFFAAYILVLMRWVLPRLGVPTSMSGSCDAESWRKSSEKNKNGER